MGERNWWPEFSETGIRDGRGRKRGVITAAIKCGWKMSFQEEEGSTTYMYFLISDAEGLPPLSHLLLTWVTRNGKRHLFCNLQVMTLSCSSRELNICSTSHVWLFSGLTQVMCAKRSGAAICSRDANYCLHEAAENRALEHVCMAVN